MHESRRRKIGQFDHKTAVLGMLETGSRQVRAHVIPNARRDTLQNAILERVGFGSTLHTDTWAGYDRMDMRYVHEQVNHANEYVRGHVSTQAIENFWSCLKRTLKGTYVAVEAFHMDKYLAEQTFRFNNRIGMNDGDRFAKALAQVGGKRLTWNELTGKEAPSA
jgi:transposase-like protein